MNEINDGRNATPPLFRDDESIAQAARRTTPANVKVLAALVVVLAGAIAAVMATQNRMSDQEKRTAAVEGRVDRNDAADHVRDSILIEINAERRSSTFPAPAPRRGRPIDYTRRTRDHTETRAPLTLWINYPFPGPACDSLGGWMPAEMLNSAMLAHDSLAAVQGPQ